MDLYVIKISYGIFAKRSAIPEDFFKMPVAFNVLRVSCCAVFVLKRYFVSVLMTLPTLFAFFLSTSLQIIYMQAKIVTRLS